MTDSSPAIRRRWHERRLLALLVGRVGSLGLAFSMFGLRGWLVALVAGAAALVAIGVPTDLIGTPLFLRMIEARTQDYVIWIASAGLVGLIAGTYAAATYSGSQGGVLSGGLLSYLAVGCPICNKFVVLALGTSGALTFFGPAQIYIGLASLGLLAWTLTMRADAITRGCELRPD